jgi:hypothetical protein
MNSFFFQFALPLRRMDQTEMQADGVPETQQFPSQQFSSGTAAPSVHTFSVGESSHVDAVTRTEPTLPSLIPARKALQDFDDTDDTIDLFVLVSKDGGEHDEYLGTVPRFGMWPSIDLLLREAGYEFEEQALAMINMATGLMVFRAAQPQYNATEVPFGSYLLCVVTTTK